jgi:nucleoside-diphosphate-sugar epimerase
VLGASGFIGKHTLRALLARGVPVTAAVRRPRSLGADRDAAASDGRLRIVRAELGADAELRAAIRGSAVVLHLATGGGGTWEEIERAMVAGTRGLAVACVEEGVGRLVYVSSIAALYLGPDCGTDVVEDDAPTDPPPEARALYARGKIAAEGELVRLHRERGLGVTIVRPGVVVGADAPFQHSGIGLWVRDNHCVGWGTGVRPLPLVLVEDVADALARVALAPGDAALAGRALNLAARVPLTAGALVAEYARRTGRDVHFHPRALALSQGLEIGKWLVKRAGGRGDAFPSYRDLKSRSLWPALACQTARGLGWQPCEDPREMLARLLP